jgi:hypothetical protein
MLLEREIRPAKTTAVPLSKTASISEKDETRTKKQPAVKTRAKSSTKKKTVTAPTKAATKKKTVVKAKSATKKGSAK